jgi:hypothetical protein
VVTFINGITASTVANRSDWPAARQIGQLQLQLQLLHAWAVGVAASKTAAPKSAAVLKKSRKASA